MVLYDFVWIIELLQVMPIRFALHMDQSFQRLIVHLDIGLLISMAMVLTCPLVKQGWDNVITLIVSQHFEASQMYNSMETLDLNSTIAHNLTITLKPL
mmetsp:Transcript_12273/g.13574  ORF Transcript_12273/g.13574 Transcript_12273/m.13574 type:complete len:98 (+) Transcript_12273:282-575(+)